MKALPIVWVVLMLGVGLAGCDKAGKTSQDDTAFDPKIDGNVPLGKPLLDAGVMKPASATPPAPVAAPAPAPAAAPVAASPTSPPVPADVPPADLAEAKTLLNNVKTAMNGPDATLAGPFFVADQLANVTPYLEAAKKAQAARARGDQVIRGKLGAPGMDVVTASQRALGGAPDPLAKIDPDQLAYAMAGTDLKANHPTVFPRLEYLFRKVDGQWRMTFVDPALGGQLLGMYQKVYEAEAQLWETLAAGVEGGQPLEAFQNAVQPAIDASLKQAVADLMMFANGALGGTGVPGAGLPVPPPVAP